MIFPAYAQGLLLGSHKRIFSKKRQFHTYIKSKLKGSLGLGPFFDFQMLRLSGLAAQQCPRPTGHTSHCYVYCSLYISSLVRFFKVVFSYVNLGCNKIVLYCTLCACFSWPMMLSLQAKMPREGTWVNSEQFAIEV